MWLPVEAYRLPAIRARMAGSALQKVIVQNRDMPKVDYRRYSPAHRQHCYDLLIGTLAAFGLPEKGRTFLQDLLTESEVTMFARRIEIARRLLRGLWFEEIMLELHVGRRTVAAVDRWLDGKLHGYRAELCPAGRRGGAPVLSYTFESLRKKYPAHFLLINILLENSK
ncbi:hypothetical protein HZA45_03385 [Candidatus Peregrinibacteria bacterium]|nr:hypothetical protein [Candidatus Peregrinibacteria bacterium]